MSGICKYHAFSPQIHINEDIFFSSIMANLFNMPTSAKAAEFSVETMYKLGSLGCHAIDKWLTPEQCEMILNQYK
jgi:hypothetical protein